jgi:hypothetical protein
MPKEVISYSNTVIYKIFCNDATVTDLYVGHTTNFIKRKYQHKVLCNSGKKLKLYDIIRQNGGWDNWTMTEIAKYNCQDATEARIREQEHYDLLNPSLNLVNPISNNEYTVLHIDTSIKIKDELTVEHQIAERNQTKNDKFYCTICQYGTCNKKDYNKHLSTVKHVQKTKSTIVNNKSPQIPTPFICDCGRQYKERTGLWRHKKKCEENNENDKESLNKELIMMLIKENSDLKNMVLDVCQKIQPINNTINSNNVNSNNKTFNLNVFLNEHCKDAMNITDFVDSLKLQLSDLESVGKLGFVNGISNIIVKNLNSLDETKRPIHCTDTKREVLYIKDEDKWEKNNESNNKIRKVIKKIANKNARLLPEFKKEHPDCVKAVSKFSDQYNKIIVEAMGGSGDNDLEKEDKIIRNIAKEVAIDKNLY